MATTNAEEGYGTCSQASDLPDRMNGDADLDYTITMNDWKDDASNDSSNNITMKETHKTALPSRTMDNVGASERVESSEKSISDTHGDRDCRVEERSEGQSKLDWTESDPSLNSLEIIKNIKNTHKDKEGNNEKTVHEESKEKELQVSIERESEEKELEAGQEKESVDTELEDGKKMETVDTELEDGKKMETVDKELKDGQEKGSEDTELGDGKKMETVDKELEDGQEKETVDTELEDGKKMETVDKELKDGKKMETVDTELEDGKKMETVDHTELEDGQEREEETADNKLENSVKINASIHNEKRILSEDLKNASDCDAEDEADLSPENDVKTKVGEKEVDEIIEIDDSDLMRPLRKKINDAGLQPIKQTSNVAPVGMPSYTGAAANILPYLSISGASLLPSGSGIHLILPQGTAGIQGSNMMYLPNNGALIQVGATSSASVFSPQVAIQAHNSRSLLNLNPQQQHNVMGGQANRLLSSHNQAQKPPDKPVSSIGMIEMIRWETENHINIKPKYVKPNPKAELGHLAKWTFDLGSDLVKGYVYRDLVRIQHMRKGEGSLSNKEKEDFIKLQEIDKELNQKVGHLKVKLVKSCKCGFRTELAGVLYDHQQHAHSERGGLLSCVLCPFTTRQPSAFRFHMEAEHNRVGVIENRPGFYECSLCPYETNYTNRLEQHKVRCQRQYREAFNLHPSSITGPEVSLCLENVFYFVFTRQFMNTIIPKPPPHVSSSRKIRDIPSHMGAPVNSLLAGRAATNISTRVRPLVPKVPIQYPQRPDLGTKQQSQLNANMSRNFPVISSKIDAVPNQASKTMSVANQPLAPTHTSGRSQLPVGNQIAGPNQISTGNGFEVCEICGGYVKDRKALRIHFFHAHRIDMPFGVFERPLPPLYCATCFARFWTAQGLQKHIEVHKNDMMGAGPSQSSNGVAGKCISCGHRVPNILMHMRMVHNRELRHYLAALMCIFCGNRFTSKTGVETHMSKVHGVIVKNSNEKGQGSKPFQRMTQSSAKPTNQANTGATTQVHTAVSKGSGRGKMKSGSQCVLCNLSFNRNVDLTRHCMRVHHTCMKCGLVVVDRESLARHTCLHSAAGMRSCQICKESGFHPAYYIKHMRDKHLRKCSVVLRHIDRAVVETINQPITISDSEDDEPVSQPTEAKRPKTDFIPKAGIGKICEKTEVVDELREEDIETPVQEKENVDHRMKESRHTELGERPAGSEDLKEKTVDEEKSKDTICDDKNMKCLNKSDGEEHKREKGNCLDKENSNTCFDNEAVVSDGRGWGTEGETSHRKEDIHSDGKKDWAFEDKIPTLSIREREEKGDAGEGLHQKRKLEDCDDDEESPVSKKMLSDSVDGPKILAQD